MPSDPGRIVILSDTHLGPAGRKPESVDQLRPLWQGANRLILNGDVAEVHDPQQQARAAREVLRLQELTEDDGVELTLLSGNHDPHLSDRRFLRLFGGEVFLTHGDMLHPSISPWSDHGPKLAKLHEQALASLHENSPDTSEELANKADAAAFASVGKWDQQLDQNLPPAPHWRKPLDKAQKIARVLWYWHLLPGMAKKFATQHAPDCRFFIFGHIHRAGVWQCNSQGRDQPRWIINTGAYDFPANPRAVVIEHGKLSVHRVQLNDATRTYAMQPQPLLRETVRYTSPTRKSRANAA